MSDQEIETIQLKVKTVDLEGKGFLPKYRRLLQVKQAFSDPVKATVEDFDGAMEWLMDHIVEPSKAIEKRNLLDDMTPEDFMALFEQIAGQSEAVSPPSGGASGDISVSSE